MTGTLEIDVPLSETYLLVVRVLNQPRAVAQCVNKESLLESRNYVQLEQTDFFANSKDLIQSGRIQIRVASLFLVSFRHLSVCWVAHIYLYQYKSSFCGTIYHIVLSPVVCVLEFHLWKWKMKWRRGNLAEAPGMILTTQDCWSIPLNYVLDTLQTEEAFTVKEYKDRQTDTHTHTHTYTHTRTHTHTQMKSFWSLHFLTMYKFYITIWY